LRREPQCRIEAASGKRHAGEHLRSVGDRHSQRHCA
jgi:hypothetical protein